MTLAALAAAMLLGWWLVRVGLRPLADVERTAEAIADGELHQRVPVDHPKTEVGRLATVLNTMLGRIQEAFAERDETEAELRESEDRMRRFVGDASHELRTPLAAVSAYAELLDDGVVAARRTRRASSAASATRRPAWARSSRTSCSSRAWTRAGRWPASPRSWSRWSPTRCTPRPPSAPSGR